MSLSLLPLLVLGWLLPSEPGRAAPATLAVIGDSLSTGAVTNPALRFDSQVLWEIFNGKVATGAHLADLPPDLAGGLSDPPPPPQRLWPSTREFFGGPDWVWRNTLQSLSRRYLDTAEYSWGYLLGLGLKLNPAEVVLAGEDGARVANIPRHVDRLLTAGGGELPRLLVLFYTGNDLCGSAPSELTTSEEFAEDLTRGLAYIERNGQLGPSGSDVYVLSFLNILQLVTNDTILAKKVHAFGTEMSCKELRDAGYQPSPAQQAAMLARAEALAKSGAEPAPFLFAQLMPPNPAGICATLFAVGTGTQRDTELGALANHIRDYRDHEKALVQSFNDRTAAKGLRFHYVEETSHIVFNGEDVAEDCFHLSVAGQTKIARAALPAVQAAGVGPH